MAPSVDIGRVPQTRCTESVTSCSFRTFSSTNFICFRFLSRVSHGLEFLLQVKRRCSLTFHLLQPLFLSLVQLLAFSVVWISGTAASNLAPARLALASSEELESVSTALRSPWPLCLGNDSVVLLIVPPPLIVREPIKLITTTASATTSPCVDHFFLLRSVVSRPQVHRSDHDCSSLCDARRESPHEHASRPCQKHNLVPAQ